MIFTFDGDEAGRAAAMKAFEGDQKMAGQTYVAVAPDGMDPCELRQASGDTAVRDLVARRVPLFRFVVKSLLAEHDLETAEGRVEALRRTVPVVARIKDTALREDYARQLAGWVGWDDISAVIRRVRAESRRTDRPKPQQPSRFREETPAPAAPVGPPRPNPRDPALWPQRDALKAALQHPELAGSVFDSLPAETFGHPAYALVRQAMAEAGGTAAGLGGAEWMDAVARYADPVQSLVTELAVEPIRAADVPDYIPRVLARLQEVWVGQQVADLKSRLQRMSQADRPDEYMSLFGDLVALEQYRRSLLEQAVGDNAEEF